MAQRIEDLMALDGGMPRRALAVVAHPDDETFGLGAVLAALTRTGTEVRLVCLTHGEASTLSAGDDLAERRGAELTAAAAALGLADAAVYDHGDGQVADVADGVLDGIVDRHVDGADLVVVFEPSGVTGHPDHRAATAAALRVAARRGLPVLEWGVSPLVATTLRDELGAPFVPLQDGAVDVTVDRLPQLAAVACHASQATDNAVLRRRLELQGTTERVRYRRLPA